MSESIEQTLAAYKQSRTETQERRMVLTSSLADIVGSRVKVVGFPSSMLMTIHNTKTGQIVRRITIPVYGLVEQSEDLPLEPREVEVGILHSANNDTITVSFIRDGSEELQAHQATGYNFRLNQIISLELLPEVSSTQL